MQLTPGLQGQLSRLKKSLPGLREEDRRKVAYIIEQTKPRYAREEGDLRDLLSTGIRIINPYEKKESKLA
jgi:hypothetical protein